MLVARGPANRQNLGLACLPWAHAFKEEAPGGLKGQWPSCQKEQGNFWQRAHCCAVACVFCCSEMLPYACCGAEIYACCAAVATPAAGQAVLCLACNV